MSEGVDYSWGRPSPQRLVELGYKFVMRYLPYPGHGGKGLSIPELQDLLLAGLKVGFIFQSTSNRALEGFSAGVQEAEWAERALVDLKVRPNAVVYFAVDFNAQPFEYPMVREYFRGVVSVMGLNRVGVYGGSFLMEDLRVHQLATWFWQAFAPAWSNYSVYSWNHLHQYQNGVFVDGHAVDYVRTFGSEQGLYSGELVVTRTEYEDLVIAVYSGREERGLTREKRLENALYRMREAVNGNAPSVNDRAASAMVIALRVAAAIGAAGLAATVGLNTAL